MGHSAGGHSSTDESGRLPRRLLHRGMDRVRGGGRQREAPAVPVADQLGEGERGPTSRDAGARGASAAAKVGRRAASRDVSTRGGWFRRATTSLMSPISTSFAPFAIREAGCGRFASLTIQRMAVPPRFDSPPGCVRSISDRGRAIGPMRPTRDSSTCCVARRLV